jgi:hypothetical protein
MTPARRLLSLLPLAFAAAAVAAVGGCGSDKPQRARAPVRLTVDAPLDAATVDRRSVEVSGRVWPEDAWVLVGGREAQVDGGAFSFVVDDLHAGANVIDVEAGAPSRGADMTAVRVTRRVPVEVPDLSGEAPDDAVAALKRLGLGGEVEQSGGLLDELLPGDPVVCETDPPAGERVRAGTTVTVRVSKRC